MIPAELLFPLLVFLVIVLLVFSASSLVSGDRQMVMGRLGKYVGAPRSTATAATVPTTILRDRPRLSSISLLDALLLRSSYAERKALELAAADIPLRVGEYILIRWVIAVVALLASYQFLGVLPLALGLAALAYAAPGFYVKHQQQKRRDRFNEQLVDSLSLIANSLKSGYSFLQGMELVVREMPPPSSKEFAQVVQEVSLGSDVEEALIKMAHRVGSYDLDLAVTAMLIQRQVGGNLAEVLEGIAHTIRERFRILREVRTRTAAARMSGYIIGVLPFVLAVAISAINPEYMGLLFNHSLGRVIVVVAVLMQVAGFLLIRRIVNIEV